MCGNNDFDYDELDEDDLDEEDKECEDFFVNNQGEENV
jgi:hypothetical protein